MHSNSWGVRWPLRALQHPPVVPTQSCFPGSKLFIPLPLTPSFWPLPTVASFVTESCWPPIFFFPFEFYPLMVTWTGSVIKAVGYYICKPSLFKAVKKMKILPAQESFYVAMPIRQTHEATWGNGRLRALCFHWWQPGRGRKKGVYLAVLNVYP